MIGSVKVTVALPSAFTACCGYADSSLQFRFVGMILNTSASLMPLPKNDSSSGWFTNAYVGSTRKIEGSSTSSVTSGYAMNESIEFTNL